jgi:hypothetical protein
LTGTRKRRLIDFNRHWEGSLFITKSHVNAANTISQEGKKAMRKAMTVE